MQTIKKDLTGQKFGNLTALGFYGFVKGKSWRTYKCDCGNVINARGSAVTNGHRKSCGCLNHKFTKHNMTGTNFYKKWTSLKQRCNNKNNKCYKDYGGRGIGCERKSFEEFYNDMYDDYLQHVEKYGEKQTTLDRIDVNGNYCKDNCKRATRLEQGANKRNNIICKYNNEVHTLEERYRILLKHKI